MPYFHLFHNLSNMLLHIWLQVFAYFVECLFYPKKKALSLSSYLFNSWDVTLASVNVFECMNRYKTWLASAWRERKSISTYHVFIFVGEKIKSIK